MIGTWYRRLWRWGMGGLVLLVVFLWWSYDAVERHAEGRVTTYESVDELDDDYTILLLGTSAQLADGRKNLFYVYRMQAMKELLDQRIGSGVLVSGDNGHVSYNEPETMKQSLIGLGWASGSIVMDYAGFRTLDSVVRARDVFDAEPLLIVSQPFHVERALYIADHHGIAAHGYAARDVSLQIAPRVYLREILARGWMMLDLYVWRTQPRFPE